MVKNFVDSPLATSRWAYTLKPFIHEKYWCGYREQPTHYIVLCTDNRWRRLYAYPLGNSSVLYIKSRGEKLYVHDCDMPW